MSTRETYAVLVTIPNCVAIQELGETSIPLATGTLSLIKYPSSILVEPAVPSATVEMQSALPHDVSLKKSSQKPVLTLQIAKLAFPLMKNTLFGTDANAPGSYLFVPELDETYKGAYVRICLPEEAQIKSGEGGVTLQDVFERELIAEGLLKEGWAAITDELHRSVTGIVEGIRGNVSSGLATEKGLEPPESTAENEGR